MAVGAAEQPPREQLARRIDEAALAEAKGKLEGFLDETQRVGVSPAEAAGAVGKQRGRRRGVGRPRGNQHAMRRPRERQGCQSSRETRNQSTGKQAGLVRFCSTAIPEPPACLQIELEGADLAEWRRQLAACTDPAAICRFLLAVEEVYCHAGEGLPRGETLAWGRRIPM